MYNGMKKIEEIIDYIEANLTSEIDYEAMASRMTLSVYEFRRIFAFIIGAPISEYIRKRRLSLAACELMTDSKVSIQKISEKYGYSTPSAFSKAFSEYHGFSPTVCQKESPAVSLFPRPKFEWNIRRAESQDFRIICDGAYAIRGYSGISDHTDTCCCENVWNDFYESGKDAELSSETLFVSYRDEGGVVKCCIGERNDDAREDNDPSMIPECSWLTAKMTTTDDDAVNRKYNLLLYDVLPSVKLKRKAGIPTVEVFPRDMSRDDFEWEIRIPIEKE
ncbi:MAG: helix-turn-helix transcriptional regulator [Clostridia bacterium]|nr:helix-turn-helix transcriptional regulator [Clostridia bacterium]